MLLKQLHKSHQEAINAQYNDPLILKMEDVIRDARNAYERQKNGLNFTEYNKKLSLLAQQRFGIPIKFVDDPNAPGPCTITYSVIDESTGFDHTSDFVSDTPGVLFKLLRKVFSNDHQKRLEEATGPFTKFMKNGAGIKIDVRKAYIEGLPKEYDCVIFLNWEDMFTPSTDWYIPTDRMFMGVLLHEIGHVFSRLEYLYKTRRSVVAFEDVCRDIAKRKVNNGYEYVVTYKNLTGSNIDVSKYKNSSVAVCYIGVLKDIGARYIYGEDKKASVDMEFVADQFATRFGYGAEVSDFVLEFAKKGYLFQKSETAGPMAWSAMCLITLASLIFGAFICGIFGISAFIIPVAISLALGIGMAILILFFSDTTATYDNVYDIPYLRVERMCIDMKRQLRLFGEKMTGEQRQKILVGISNIDNMLVKLKKLGYDTRGVNESPIAELLNKTLKNRRELVEFSEDLERIMENDLHVELNRLKTL